MRTPGLHLSWRGSVVLCVLLAAAGMLPAHAGNDPADHSANMQLVDEIDLAWPAEADLSDLAFQGRSVIGSVSGGAGKIYAEGDATEGGIGIFRRSSSDRLSQLGRFRCQAMSRITVLGDIVLQGSIRSQQAGTTGNPRNECDRNGLRIIDISDPAHPREAAFLPINCGVSEHAVVSKSDRLYVYLPSSCDQQTETPPNAGLFNEMAVVRIPLADPSRAAITGIVDLSPMSGCGEIAVIPSKDLAACVGYQQYILLDISDPPGPATIGGSLRTLERSRIMSVAFSWDGSYIAFGNGIRRELEPSVDIHSIEDPTNPVSVGTWSVPAGEGIDQIVYSVSFVPMRDGRRVLAVGHAARGAWLVDITDPTTPKEIAHYTSAEAAQPSLDAPVTSSFYWYNGRFFSTEGETLRMFRVRGFDRQTVHFFRSRYNPQSLMVAFR